MIRSAFLTLAVFAMVASTNAAYAGGRGGSSKSNNQYVRIKNIGSQPALVNAKNGAATTAAGGKTVSSNGVAQFTIKKGAARAYAQNQAATGFNPLDFSFPKSQYVYLLVVADNTTATPSFAKPGQIF